MNTIESIQETYLLKTGKTLSRDEAQQIISSQTETLRALRDKEIPALPPVPNRHGQTIVGEISGYGDRHVILPESRVSQPSPPYFKRELPSAGVASTHPFHLADASNEDDGTQVRVYYGTVLDVVPSGMSPGDSPPYILPVSGDGFIWLVISIDDPTNRSVVLSVAIDLGDPVPTNLSDTIYLQIGSYSTGDTTVATADNLTGSQWYEDCAGNPLFGVI